MDRQVRILIADDHEMVRRGLRTVLEARGDWSVAGEAANGREAVAEARRLLPDVVIMDITMPEMNGLDATRQIRRECPNTHVLILTMHASEQLIHEVVLAGARGYVLKSDAGSVLVTAIENLCRGEAYFTSRAADMMLRAYLSPAQRLRTEGTEPLTPREREMVQLIAEGRSTKEVASLLVISVKTAETHRVNLMRKLGVHSVSEIVRYAIRNRLIEP